MKKALLTGNLLFTSFVGFTQTILSGSEFFDKERKDGFYMNISIEKKFVEKDWSLFISKYGRVAQSKEVYNIKSANFPDISQDPINLMTKVTSDQKVKTKIFASFIVDGGNTISENINLINGAEKLLKDFYAFAMQNEDIRLAERDVEESLKNLDRVNRTADKLTRDIEKNKREKEKLLKEIEENKIELENLLKDQVANKQDQENARISVQEKQKATSILKTGIK
nr:hypothetical protein [uncultured Emticicia sp.]